MTQTNQHQNRVAVITGGSGGIGGAIAARLKDAGAMVHGVDAKAPSAGESTFHQVDVANENEVDRAFDAIGKPAYDPTTSG